MAASEASAAAAKEAQKNSEINALENSRQAITNPYKDFSNVSGMAKDLSGMITNPYANLGVATRAAKIQIEESDIALANTLDALAATGMGGGGATALAQMALKSKQGVSASIEEQEAQNEKLKAQGEAQMQQIKMSEAQRVQGIQISEAQRMQEAQARGNEFVFQAQENRDNQKLNRLAGLADRYANQQQQARAAEIGAWSSSASSESTLLSSGVGSFNAPTKKDIPLELDKLNTPTVGLKVPNAYKPTSFPLNK